MSGPPLYNGEWIACSNSGDNPENIMTHDKLKNIGTDKVVNFNNGCHRYANDADDSNAKYPRNGEFSLTLSEDKCWTCQNNDGYQIADGNPGNPKGYEVFIDKYAFGTL